MSKIEQVKSYTGKDLETIFFRPMLSGTDAEELGIKVMYNMPVPTTLHFWRQSGEILQKYTASGWDGGSPAEKFQKTINLSKVKAEVGYSADDYFTMVYELVTGRADVNLDDLSGTELEQAETTLFKEAIRESIRATMWLGDTSRGWGLNTFDGFLKRITEDATQGDSEICSIVYTPKQLSDTTLKLFRSVWEMSSEQLKASKPQGNLVYLVSSDVYSAYENALDNMGQESAYQAIQDGRPALCYRGIPVIDIQVESYFDSIDDLPRSFIMLTDRRNLALAVNTNDFPGTEVRMWYNPDQMENRQRAIFMAGCDYLLPELISFACGAPQLQASLPSSSTGGAVSVNFSHGSGIVKTVSAMGVDASDDPAGDEVELTLNNGSWSGTIAGTGITKVLFTVGYFEGSQDTIMLNY